MTNNSNCISATEYTSTANAVMQVIANDILPNYYFDDDECIIFVGDNKNYGCDYCCLASGEGLASVILKCLNPEYLPFVDKTEVKRISKALYNLIMAVEKQSQELTITHVKGKLTSVCNTGVTLDDELHPVIKKNKIKFPYIFKPNEM